MRFRIPNVIVTIGLALFAVADAEGQQGGERTSTIQWRPGSEPAAGKPALLGLPTASPQPAVHPAAPTGEIRPAASAPASPVVPAWFESKNEPAADWKAADPSAARSADPPAAPAKIEADSCDCVRTFPHLFDSLHDHDNYGFKSLFDSLHPKDAKRGNWYDKLNLRGYTQFRFGRTLYQAPNSADPSLLADRSINGNAENFSVRRARFILFGDISDHLYFYFQPDFAVLPQGATTTSFFGHIRDLYADVYIDTTKIHRFRVGMSKIPYGFENLQSSQNRVPLDRTDPINTGVTPNERDLGVFYYWTPVEKQKLFRELVDGGLKGSGNFGIFGIGIYNGQGGSQLEQNLNLHGVVRVTYPFLLPSGQVVEPSIQAYRGEFVVPASPIRALGRGPEITPKNTGGDKGLLDERIAGTFVWYPQPFGFQAEYNWGRGPGLNDEQTAVIVRGLNGGYGMFMYKWDTQGMGIVTPYARYQYYQGGYRSIANAPYGKHRQWDLGVEWQIRKEMELVVEYSFVDGVALNAINKPGQISYRDFDGGILRAQFQVNY